MQVQVLFFASLRESLGTEGQKLELPEDVTTAGKLADHLAATDPARFGILTDRNAVLVAVNQELVTREHSLTDGDEIAFFPPVTGG